MTGAVSRALAVCRQEGLTALVKRVWGHWFDVQTQLLMAADASSAWNARHLHSVCWEELHDTSRLVDPELQYSAALAACSAGWLARGDRCLVGTEQGRIVTYLWLAFSLRELPRYAWPIAPDCVFVYKTFTRSSHRGRGLNRAALAEALRLAKVVGRNRVFIDVRDSNHASVRAIRAAGFSEVGRFKILRIGSRRRTFVSRPVRRLVTEATAEKTHVA